MAESLQKAGAVSVERYLELKELASAVDTPEAGRARIYRGDDGKFYGIDSDGISTPVGSGGAVKLITQNTHGFLATEIGAPMYLNGALYTRAIGDTDPTSEVVGVLSRRIDADKFELTSGGEVTGLVAAVFQENALPTVGSIVWLSATVAGKLTVTKPNVIGLVEKPQGYVTRSDSGTCDIIYVNMRGSIVGGVNAVVPRFLANGAKTLIQDFSNMDGGKVRGVLTIVSDTPLRNEYEIRFVKNGVGVYQGTATGLGGDAAGLFEMDNDGKLQCTIATHTGFTSARFDYQVNAPNVGAKFPIAIGESNVLADGGAIGGFATLPNNSNTVLNFTSPRVSYINNPSIPISVSLPTGVEIKAGYRHTLVVNGATDTNYVRLNTGSGVEVDRFGLSSITSGSVNASGEIEVVALQDNPTTRAHWRVVRLEEIHPMNSAAPVFTGTTPPSGTSETYAIVRRTKNTIHFTWNRTYAVAGTAITEALINIATFPTAIKDRIKFVNNWVYTSGIGGFGTNTTGPVLASARSYLRLDNLQIGIVPASGVSVRVIQFNVTLELVETT